MIRHAGQVAWFISLLSMLVASILLSWFALSVWDYGFSIWYEYYEIRSHIDHYGPQNRYINGLSSLSAQEHVRLFSEITQSVHNHGHGLANIGFSYQGKSQAMLRVAEVVHLQDVANLIDGLRMLLYVSLLMVAVCVPVLVWIHCRPIWKIQGSLLLAVIASLVGWLVVEGPKDVFYQVHVWIFPPEHEWFFYYQDSLMSTLMKAPYLFGGIATVIVIGAVLIFSATLLFIKQLNARPIKTRGRL